MRVSTDFGVSVVIPTLDEEENLPRCLESLKPQLGPEDEVIVVDGGSKDDTIQIARAYGCRILVKEDSSIGEARNIGTMEAVNEIVVSTDADAIPPEGWLDKIKVNFDKDEDLVVLWGTIVDVNGVPIRNLIGKFSTVVRGASGNNTAFRKSAYEKLDFGYPDISFMEDVSVIHQLAEEGKAKRDRDLVMVMNMDRRRYQTFPILVGGGLVSAAGVAIGGKWGRRLFFGGVGSGMTEMLYEGVSDQGGAIHHDDVGMTMLGISSVFDGEVSDAVYGTGLGLFVHHAVTEGISKIPSKLMANTDEVA
jgi:glycosyltransferase involved in cell wall biosynthesis